MKYTRAALVLFVASLAIIIVILHYRAKTIILFGSLKTTDDPCDIPSSGYKAWNNGLVTVLKPEIQKDCQKLFDGDPDETRKVHAGNARWKNHLSDSNFLQITKNCSWVQDYFSKNLYVTKLELVFPIAFSFVVYNSPQQIVRMLKLLYRPHNQYCIHPDIESSAVFVKIFYNIAKCLKNVHVSSRLHKVHWGHYSIMESQMHCFWDLVHIRNKQPEEKKWKYVINLCGKELPLNTNREVVSHLVRLNGTSAVDAAKMSRNDRNEMGRLRGRRIPFDLPYYKSMTYMALSYKFVHFLFTNSTAIQVYEFFKGCDMPEEHYYATLYMLPNIPGGYNHNVPKHYYFETDSYFWHRQWHKSERQEPCFGKIVHQICIVTVGDMRRVLLSSDSGENALFHNKYFMEHDHTIMDCMEERIVAKNQLEYDGDCSTNTK